MRHYFNFMSRLGASQSWWPKNSDLQPRPTGCFRMKAAALRLLVTEIRLWQVTVVKWSSHFWSAKQDHEAKSFFYLWQICSLVGHVTLELLPALRLPCAVIHRWLYALQRDVLPTEPFDESCSNIKLWSLWGKVTLGNGSTNAHECGGYVKRPSAWELVEMQRFYWNAWNIVLYAS